MGTRESTSRVRKDWGSQAPPDDLGPAVTAVFVYGANLQGIHGAGAAKAAHQQHGAVWGKYGRHGASYGIPTKATPWRSLPLGEVRPHVLRFLAHAAEHPDDTFHVTPIGCGLAGFVPRQIAPMFRGHGTNVILPPLFGEVLSWSAS